MELKKIPASLVLEGALSNARQKLLIVWANAVDLGITNTSTIKSQVKHHQVVVSRIPLPEAPMCSYATSTPKFLHVLFPCPRLIHRHHTSETNLAGNRLLLVENVGEVAAAAVLAVGHGGHEDTGTALATLLASHIKNPGGNWRKTHGIGGALAAETLDATIGSNLIVLEDGQLGLLALVLDLLGGGVHLLLALLGTTTQAEDEVEGALLLDVVVAEGAAVLELLASKDQALLIRGDALLVLDLGLDIVDGVRRLHLKGDSLTREGLDEDLHLA